MKVRQILAFFFPTLTVLMIVGAVALDSAWAEDPKVPELSPEARQGGLLFMGKCASCHGFYAQGTKQGPPLLHPYYNPGHHADPAFYSAIRNGARQHHWGFGDMKPVDGVTDQQIPLIIRYVRELQKANGIF